jgi:hypothetical protein
MTEIEPGRAGESTPEAVDIIPAARSIDLCIPSIFSPWLGLTLPSGLDHRLKADDGERMEIHRESSSEAVGITRSTICRPTIKSPDQQDSSDYRIRAGCGEYYRLRTVRAFPDFPRGWSFSDQTAPRHLIAANKPPFTPPPPHRRSQPASHAKQQAPRPPPG